MKLTQAQTESLTAHLDDAMTLRQLTPAEILVEIETWALEQDDPNVNQWLWNQQAEANGTTRETGVTSGFALRDHFNSIEARDLSFHQAAQHGIELVHHPDSDHSQVFHTADGDIVHFSEENDTWEVVENGRRGANVVSGEMGRKHLAGVDDTARVHSTAVVADTATIEPGARIGPHSTVGEHAHVGTDSTIASYARVEDGAFVGPYASVRDGSRVGPGAVVGTGASIGSTSNVGAGARVAQHAQIDAFDNIAANSKAGGSSTRPVRQAAGQRSGQVAALVDRLAQLDRD